MSHRALNYITGLFATAGAAEDETLPLCTPPAYVEDEYSLEDPLLLPTTTEGDIEAPPPSTSTEEAAATADEDNPESIPTSSSTRDSIGTKIIYIMRDSRCEKVIVFSMLLICFAIAVFYFATNVNDIANDPGFRLDSVTVTSFNVSRNLLETTWDTELSFNLVEGSSADVRFEAPRLWLYSRDGFSTRTYPSLHYSPDGKKLILHAVFSSMQKKVLRSRVVKLDMMMEVNTIRVVHAHTPKVEIRWFVTIDCNDLKIEFDTMNKRYGRLIDNGGENRCRVQVCTLEWHPLYDGADKCITSFRTSNLQNISSSFRTSNLRNIQV